MANESVKVSDVIRMFEMADNEEIMSALFNYNDFENIETYIADQKDGMIQAIERVVEGIDYMIDSKTRKPIDVNIFCKKYLGLEEMRIKTFLAYLKSGRFTTGQVISFFERLVVKPEFEMMEVTV